MWLVRWPEDELFDLDFDLIAQLAYLCTAGEKDSQLVKRHHSDDGVGQGALEWIGCALGRHGDVSACIDKDRKVIIDSFIAGIEKGRIIHGLGFLEGDDRARRSLEKEGSSDGIYCRVWSVGETRTQLDVNIYTFRDSHCSKSVDFPFRNQTFLLFLDFYFRIGTLITQLRAL